MKKTRPGFLLSTVCLLSASYKNCYLLCVTLFLGTASIGQSIYPSTINTAGQSAAFGNYRFEWSIGESVAINTMTSGSLVVTNGLLQYYVENQPLPDGQLSWSASEIKIYPNPTKDHLQVNLLLGTAGHIYMQLIDIAGNRIREMQFDYNGLGTTENWSLGFLRPGIYMLNVQQISPVSGRPIKNGSFKILIIQ